jgi:hypothetical protein
MGGIGKTILATCIAHDEQVRFAFPDGVIWVTIGRRPDIVGSQKNILQNLDALNISPETPHHGINLLNKYLVDKKMLLILDDVWNVITFNLIYHLLIKSIDNGAPYTR